LTLLPACNTDISYFGRSIVNGLNTVDPAFAVGEH